MPRLSLSYVVCVSPLCLPCWLPFQFRVQTPLQSSHVYLVHRYAPYESTEKNLGLVGLDRPEWLAVHCSHR